ncbi:MAG: single-stranded-DNA-specific exonuclease RecJ [Pseudomonadota bacterium]|nr:single-stranded-DNA-specific exonuclease RecJ [Pseudomonadota bacterium]
MDAVLNVDHSFTGKNWRSRVDGDEVARDRRATALAQRLDLPVIVAQILADREIELDQAEAYLAPTLRDLLPDPSSFRDMDQAVARLVRAIGAGEKIAVFGDYDVDGATSSALLLRFMRAVGGDIQAYIPDRIAEGYGPNAPALLKLAADGVRVVVTVDCGITAFEPLAAAAQAGLDVIVLDHHVAEPQLPTAVAVVNPNRFDENAGHGYLAAVGVCFLTTIALNRALRAAGHYQGRPEPNLLQWLDLVALGTVADVVPLVGLNRAFVQQGLKVLAGRRNTGLSALADVAGLDSRPEAYHLGFVLGPRVNAGGRVGEAGLGTRLLAADDPAEAAELARRLDAYNGDRRAIEAEVLTAAVTQAEAAGAAATSLVMVGDAGWHPGVIGIVAARLRERFGVPACVIAWDGAVGKGSGRSVPGVALGPAVLAAQQAGLLINGGGHAMAAGFTVARDRFADFQAFMTERIEAALAAAPLTQRLNIDAVVTPGGANRDLFDAMAQVGPFGAGNAEPRLACPAVKLVKADVVGENHVRCILSGREGGRLKGIAFRAMDSDLGPALLSTGGKPVHVAGHLRADDWQGRNGVQMIIDDAAWAQ